VSSGSSSLTSWYQKHEVSHLNKSISCTGTRPFVVQTRTERRYLQKISTSPRLPSILVSGGFRLRRFDFADSFFKFSSDSPEFAEKASREEKIKV
jgi:hypothetical protein